MLKPHIGPGKQFVIGKHHGPGPGRQTAAVSAQKEASLFIGRLMLCM